MIYSVSIYKPNGILNEVVSQSDMSVRHWERFEEEEVKRRGGFSIGRVAAEMNKELQSYKAFERLCDQFTYDYGV